VTKATRTLATAVGLCALLAIGVGTAHAQTGAFLCSAGSRDGLNCDSDDDCPGGVCVLSQGVCDGGSDDGFPCSCPGGSCGSSPACSADPSFGTCSGGAFAGECCDRDFNCSDGRPCTGSQKVCVGGTDAGLPCLRDSHCSGGGSCRSTGRFCLGVCQSGASRGDLCTSEDDCDGAECSSDFQDAACGQDADCCLSGSTCPAGICEGPASPTLTPTRTRTPTGPQPTRTATPTGGVTVTPEATVTPEPTGAPTPTEPAVPTPTGGRQPGQSTVARSAAAGDTTLTVIDATSFPPSGLLEILLSSGNPGAANMRIGYSKTPVSNTLFLDGPLSASVPAGTLVRSTSPPAVRYESTAEGAGCAIVPDASLPFGLLVWSGALSALLGLRRRR
jgi:hypothetical protein